jgi:uncharacterized protein YhaN
MDSHHICQGIQFLASKFATEHFKRIQLKIDSSTYNEILSFGDENLDKYQKINPKSIEIIMYEIYNT